MWYIALTLNADKTVLSLVGEPTQQSVCTYRRDGQTAAAAAAWQWAAGWEGSHLVNTGATGVSNYSLLIWDCGQLLIHCWQHLSARVACMAMSVSDGTLDMLLDHLRDLDLTTILTRMADRSEPYCPTVKNWWKFGNCHLDSDLGIFWRII